MTILACGLNHKTAPIKVRERLAITPDRQGPLLRELVHLPGMEEAAILSTCNRTEIYCHAEQSEALLPWLATHADLPFEEIQTHTYLHHQENAVRHTIRVACGLDSMMLGEPQILGQMKQAYHQACGAGTIGPNLRNLFRHVFGASKRVRSHTDIGASPVSVAFAAVNLIQQQITPLSEQTVMLIGAGDTTKLVGKYLKQAGVHDFVIANRSIDNATLLAQQLGGTPLNISDINEFYTKADIIITATACPIPFVTEHALARALQDKPHHRLMLLDLAVPRDVEPDVASLPQVTLYNIDDLSRVIAQGMDQRKLAAQHAEAIIEHETNNYIQWQRSVRANTTIRDYRDTMHVFGDMEVHRTLNKIQSGVDTEQAIRELSHRLINKIIHHPSRQLRSVTQQDQHDVLQLIDKLYGKS